MSKKVLFVSLLIAFSVGTAAFAANPAPKMEHKVCQKDHKKCPKKAVYTCPMHPEVKSDKAGKCPKCGMNLEMKQMKDACSSMHHHGK